MSRKYRSVWTDFEQFRRECSGWKSENVSDRVARHDGDRLVMDLDALHGYNNLMCSRLMSPHSHLVERVRSEIIDKHFAQLKW